MLKKALAQVCATLLMVAIKLAPLQFVHAIKQLEPPPQGTMDPKLEAKLRRHIRDDNPLREAVDRRVFPFGPRW
ncbi:MAG TPA: hypothetical protein VJ843_03490 [Candidatus Saccharimonadales bacterium]|nr:hypothetical protein [Candidatus Saccharimonadales bacterium]